MIGYYYSDLFCFHSEIWSEWLQLEQNIGKYQILEILKFVT